MGGLNQEMEISKAAESINKSRVHNNNTKYYGICSSEFTWGKAGVDKKENIAVERVVVREWRQVLYTIFREPNPVAIRFVARSLQ